MLLAAVSLLAGSITINRRETMNQEHVSQQTTADCASSAVTNIWPLAAVVAAFYGYCETLSEVIDPPSFESKK